MRIAPFFSHGINHGALITERATISASLFEGLEFFARSIGWTKPAHCCKVCCIAKAKVTLRIVENHFLSSIYKYDIMQKSARCNILCQKKT